MLDAVEQEMREHEVVHLDNLKRVMPERRVRPTAMLPLWHVAGYALGAEKY
jgi:ubiquinone biosynthesis monooxygenase Coq7